MKKLAFLFLMLPLLTACTDTLEDLPIATNRVLTAVRLWKSSLPTCRCTTLNT